MNETYEYDILRFDRSYNVNGRLCYFVYFKDISFGIISWSELFQEFKYGTIDENILSLTELNEIITFMKYLDNFYKSNQVILNKILS